MTLQRIRLAAKVPGGMLPCWAVCYGVLAAHPAAHEQAPHWRPDVWAITHIPTGLMLPLPPLTRRQVPAILADLAPLAPVSGAFGRDRSLTGRTAPRLRARIWHWQDELLMEAHF